MKILFAAKGLYVNDELMREKHSKKAIADHLKYMLFGERGGR